MLLSWPLVDKRALAAAVAPGEGDDAALGAVGAKGQLFPVRAVAAAVAPGEPAIPSAPSAPSAPSDEVHTKYELYAPSALFRSTAARDWSDYRTVHP